MVDLRNACVDAAAHAEAATATFNQQRPLGEVEATLRSASARLLAGDAAVSEEVEALDAELESHPHRVERRAERAALWDAREASACAAALARTRRLVPRNVSASTAADVRAAYHRGLEDARAARALSRRVWATPALWLIWLEPARLTAVHAADLKRRCDVAGLDVVELRAVWAACSKAAWDERGREGQAAWRVAVRRKLEEMVARERRGALLPHEARRPEYALADAHGLDLDAAPPAEEPMSPRSPRGRAAWVARGLEV